MSGSTSGLSRTVATLLAAALTIAAAATDDPFRPQQWGVDRLRAEQAWDVSRGTGVVIAVIDSGVDLGHPDLETQLHRDGEGQVVGTDYVDGDDDPTDRNGHGTMVAGIAAAAADNGIGIVGVAPEARVMPIRVLDEEGRGTPSDVDDAIRWAVDHGADVVNLSLESEVVAGGQQIGAGVSAPVAAVRYAWERGVPVVAAAGNSGNPFTDYPPTSPVLLVGASDRDDQRAGFSDAGREDAVLAPGVEIVSTWCRYRPGICEPEPRPEHPYGRADGTSFAAPSVTGVVALLLGTGLDHEEAVSRVRETARDVGPEGPDGQHGHGIVDAAAAVAGLTGAEAPSEDVSAPPAPSATAAEPTAPASPSGQPQPTASPADDRPTPAPTPSASAPTASAPPVAHDPDADADDPGAVVADPPQPPVAAEPPSASRPVGLQVVAALLVAITATTWWRVRAATGPGG